MGRIYSESKKMQCSLLNIFIFMVILMWAQSAMSLDLYGGFVEVNSSRESFGGYVLGAKGSFSLITQKVDLGLRVEYVNKGFRGDFNFFNMSTGEYIYQGIGEATIQYLQPSIEIRSAVFQSVFHPVLYLGAGASLWLNDDFVPLDPDTGGSSLHTQSATWVGYVGATLYANRFLLDVRYTRGLTGGDLFLEKEALQLGVGVSFDIGGNTGGEVR